MLLFDDGISVKAQKPQRQTDGHQEVLNQDLEPTARVLTDVVVLQTAPAQYEYVSAPICPDGSLRLSLAQVVQAKVHQSYGHR